MPIVCPADVPAGASMTATVRNDMLGAVGGGASASECERWQREKIVEGTGAPCPKAHGIRFNWRKAELVESSQPCRKPDGYEYTEDFDGRQMLGGRQIFYNFKFVSGSGGSQTRTLRDQCYRCIDTQMKYLLANPAETTLFVNIFDGDKASDSMRHFDYLKALPEYATVADRVYVGDLRGAFAWIAAQTGS